MKTYIPNNLPKDLKYYQEICILCSLIYNYVNYDSDGEPYPYSPVSIAKMRKMVGCHKAKPALEEAIKENIIERRDEGRKGYVAGHCAKLYRLTDGYKNKPMVVRTVNRKVKKEPFKHNLRGVYLKLFKDLKKLEIDEVTDEQIRTEIGDEVQYDSRGRKKNKDTQRNRARIVVDKIASGDFRGKKGSTGRLYTNVTSLNKKLRPHLHVGGKRLVAFDMSTTQPALLVAFFESYIEGIEKNIDKSKSLKQYLVHYVAQNSKSTLFHRLYEGVETVLDGMKTDLERLKILIQKQQFYENIATDLNIPRPRSKVEILKYIFGEHDNNHIRLNKYFREHFLFFHMLMAYYKRNDSTVLAMLLQSMESDVFIKTICTRLYDENPGIVLFTIHDAIVCPKGKYEDIVEAVVNDELSKVVDKPNVTKEKLI